MRPEIVQHRGEIAEFCRRHRVRRLAIFGSALGPDFGRDSDIDVLVEFLPGAAPGLEFFSMQDDLMRLFGRRVDLNTPGFLGRHMRERALREAEVLYEAA